MVTAPRPIRIAAVALLVLTSTSAGAQQVYRSIDADGNVTFSSIPPPPNAAARVDTIQLPPGPTPEQQAAADARMRQIEADSERRIAERTERQSQGATDADSARQALAQAERELERARERGAGDWQPIASGGRVPSAAYDSRVREAEARVEAARQALGSAGR